MGVVPFKGRRLSSGLLTQAFVPLINIKIDHHFQINVKKNTLGCLFNCAESESIDGYAWFMYSLF